MSDNRADDAGAVTPAESRRLFQSAFQAALKHATYDLKGLALLLAAIVALVAGYYAFEDKLKLREPWPAILCTALFLIFVLLFFVPELRDQIKLQRLRAEGIHGILVSPKYFRLTPYDVE